MYEEEWNSSQEEQRPLGKSTARNRNLAAITNCTFHDSLVHHFNTALRVGTYCHTESVHVDVGPERDWNWRCRRRSGGGDGDG